MFQATHNKWETQHWTKWNRAENSFYELANLSIEAIKVSKQEFLMVISQAEFEIRLCVNKKQI